MGALESNTTNIYGIHLRESANDGSDFSNGASDYRVLFLGEDGGLKVKDSAGAVTQVGPGSGTAFPTAPTGARFFRTDLGMEFYYDGTRWLCTCPHSQPIAMQHALLVVSATNSLRAGPPGAFGCANLWLVSLDVAIYVTTTNNGSNYWTVAYGATSVNTSADAANTILYKTASIGASWSFASDKWFQVDYTKTASAGTAYPLASIAYRYIAT